MANISRVKYVINYVATKCTRYLIIAIVIQHVECVQISSLYSLCLSARRTRLPAVFSAPVNTRPASASAPSAHLAMRAGTRDSFALPANSGHRSTAATDAAAAMAALRRLTAVAVKLNLWSTAGSELVGGRTAGGGGRGRRKLAVGLCLATGGALALYLGDETASGRSRKRMERRSISGLLPSIPAVEAKEKVGG